MQKTIAISVLALTLAGCVTRTGAGMSSTGEIYSAHVGNAKIELSSASVNCVGTYDNFSLTRIVPVQAVCNGKPTHFLFSRSLETYIDGTIYGKLPNGQFVEVAVGSGRLSATMMVH